MVPKKIQYMYILYQVIIITHVNPHFEEDLHDVHALHFPYSICMPL